MGRFSRLSLNAFTEHNREVDYWTVTSRYVLIQANPVQFQT